MSLQCWLVSCSRRGDNCGLNSTVIQMVCVSTEWGFSDWAMRMCHSTTQWLSSKEQSRAGQAFSLSFSSLPSQSTHTRVSVLSTGGNYTVGTTPFHPSSQPASQVVMSPIRAVDPVQSIPVKTQVEFWFHQRETPVQGWMDEWMD